MCVCVCVCWSACVSVSVFLRVLICVFGKLFVLPCFSSVL